MICLKNDKVDSVLSLDTISPNSPLVLMICLENDKVDSVLSLDTISPNSPLVVQYRYL